MALVLAEDTHSFDWIVALAELVNVCLFFLLVNDFPFL